MLIGARLGSPLVVGFGEGETYLGSDALALAPLTQKIAYLDEGDWVVITREGAQIFDAENNQPVSREVTTSAAPLPRRSRRATTAISCRRRFSSSRPWSRRRSALLHPPARPDSRAAADGFRPYRDPPGHHRRLRHQLSTPAWSPNIGSRQFARLPVDIDVASEFRYRDPVLQEGGLALFISQSGETADTLAALRHCKEHGQTIAVVVNVPTSSMAREADLLLPTHAGPEIGVASTKAFTCQLAVLAALAAHLAVRRGFMSRAEETEVVKHLLEAPASLNAALGHDDEIAAMAHLIAPARDVLYLGRGPDYPLALEGALKLKEISYIHAEGYASGEMKHGPIALIDEAVPVIVLAPSGPLFEKTVSNMQEVRARGGKVVLISDRDGIDEAGEGCMATIEMPKVHPLIAPLVYAVPVQLLAYHVACVKGTDVDQPRNLAKSVTVE